jgi:hypothetical protein
VLREKKKGGHMRVLTVALAAAALTLSFTPAKADTLKYGGAWFAPYSGGFTIRDSSPVRDPVTVYAGAFKMTDMTGPTLPAGSTFMAWCVDIYDFIASSASYSRESGADFYSSTTYKAADLERLASYVFDNGLLTNNMQSAAFQIAAWEVVNELAGTGSYNATSGDFRVTSGNASVLGLANGWLGIVNDGTYGITQSLSVWQDAHGGTQDLAVFAPIPEPETYAMLLAGLALMGFVARRRQRNLGAA